MYEYVKLKDIPNNTFFEYDVEKARVKYGRGVSTRDIYFKLYDNDRRNCRIIRFLYRYGAVETLLGKRTMVYNNTKNSAPHIVIKRIFTDNYRYDIGYSLK